MHETCNVRAAGMQAIAEVTQQVSAYESSELFAGNAFKVETAMAGQRVTTWIGLDGRPLFELALQGVMINALEDAGSAQRYLALAALNKKESLIEYSLVRPDRPIDNPRAASALRVALAGMDQPPPSGPNQQCEPLRREFACEIRVAGASRDNPTFGQAAADATHIKLLEGEQLADLMPLLDWVGKLKIRVLDVQHQQP